MKALTLLLAIIVLASAQNWQLYEQAFDQVSFEPSDFDDWVFTKNQNNNQFTYCGNQAVVGGYQSTGIGASVSRTIKGLPSHYKVKIGVTIYFIDSWDNEKFQIIVGGKEVYSEQSNLKWHQKLCGSSVWGERISTAEIEVPHTGDDITIVFTSTLNQGAADESFGFRDFQFSIAQCEGNCSEFTRELSGDFKKEDVQGWQIEAGNNDVSDPVWSCNGEKLLGGFKRFGLKTKISKTFENLPPHYKAIVNFKLWQIDSWDAPDNVRAIVDGKTGFVQKKKSAVGGAFSCAGTVEGWKDDVIESTIEVPHFSDSLTIQIEDNFTEGAGNESWGISDFSILLISCEDGCEEVSSELSDESFDSSAIVGWNWNNDETPLDKATACTQTSLAGGFDVLAGGTAYKYYKDLPAHNELSIGVEFWLIDSWDAKEYITVYVDDVPYVSISKTQGEWQLDIGQSCGSSNNGWNEQVQLVYITAPHFSKNAKISFKSTLNQAANDESWGFRDVHIYARQNGFKQVAQGLTKPSFDKVSNKWKISNWGKDNSPITNCAGKSLLGGFKKFSGKQAVTINFKDLPEHDILVVQFEAYFLDSWDNEAFYVELDETKRKQMFKKGEQYVQQGNLCGVGKWGDAIQFVTLEFQHSDKQAQIKFSTGLDQGAGDESWGIRNFHLSVGNNNNYMPECPTIYSECGYEGESINLCENIPNFKKQDWTQQVKSVWVPEGWKVTLFEDVKYEGKKQVFDKPAKCLKDGPAYAFLSINSTFKTALPEPKVNLRKNKVAQAL